MVIKMVLIRPTTTTQYSVHGIICEHFPMALHLSFYCPLCVNARAWNRNLKH